MPKRMYKFGEITMAFKDMHTFLEHIDERFGIYEGVHVPLEQPMIEATKDKDVELNQPKRGGKKKYYVYVKNDKGNIIKVNFGDPGLSIKRDNPNRRKNFRARHNCDNPGPKTKARFWSCRNWEAGRSVSDNLKGK